MCVQAPTLQSAIFSHVSSCAPTSPFLNLVGGLVWVPVLDRVCIGLLGGVGLLGFEVFVTVGADDISCD